MSLLGGAALAAGIHTGVPTTGVEDFDLPHFQSLETGWTALVPDGLVRVYVGPTEELAITWVTQMKTRMAKLDPKPYPPDPNAQPRAPRPGDVPPQMPTSRSQQNADAQTPELQNPELQNGAAAPEGMFSFDEAYGDGNNLLIFRDGNIGILVHVAENATKWAARTSAAITDEPAPWPMPPTLRKDELGWWHIDAPKAVHVSYIGGTRMDGAALTFTAPPRAAVAWDAFGRAVRADFDAQGATTTVTPKVP